MRLPFSLSLFLVLISLPPLPVRAAEESTPPSPQVHQVHNGYRYERPGPIDFLKRGPSDVAEYGRTAFRRKNVGWITAIVLGTGVLLVADQYLVDKAQNLGDHLGITHTASQKKFVRIPVPGIGGAEFRVEGPFDSGSTLYFIGDGWTHTLIAGSFLGHGLIQHDYRSLQTSSQIAESVIASGAVVQVLKHLTGRESPFATTHPRGNWRFFPNQKDYADNVPKYDAFPSGHLAASMAVVTVIADNYPEKRYVRPVGYTLMTVLGFQMLNNGVHWASDYPLGLALGYGFGKIAVRRGRMSEEARSVLLSPLILPDGAGIHAVVRFRGKKKHEKA